MHEAVGPSKPGWWYFVAKCACGHKEKAMTAKEADEAMERHIEEADND